jgi:hypothetical protein
VKRERKGPSKRKKRPQKAKLIGGRATSIVSGYAGFLADLAHQTAQVGKNRRSLTSALGGHLLARGHGFQRVERLSDEPGQVLLVCLVDPAIERDAEDGDACSGGQARGGLGDTALAQCTGERRGAVAEARLSPGWQRVREADG